MMYSPSKMSSSSKYMTFKVISKTEERKYKDKEGTVKSFHQCLIYEKDNKICKLSMPEEFVNKLKVNKTFKMRMLTSKDKNFRLDNNSKIFYINLEDSGINRDEMEKELNPEIVGINEALTTENEKYISIVGVVTSVSDPIETECSIRQVITMNDITTPEIKIKVKLWGKDLIPIKCDIQEVIKIKMVTVEVYGSLVSCASTALTSIEKDDEEKIVEETVEAVDLENRCILLRNEDMYEISTADLNIIFDSEKGVLKHKNVKLHTRGRSIRQLEMI